MANLLLEQYDCFLTFCSNCMDSLDLARANVFILYEKKYECYCQYRNCRSMRVHQSSVVADIRKDIWP